MELNIFLKYKFHNVATQTSVAITSSNSVTWPHKNKGETAEWEICKLQVENTEQGDGKILCHYTPRSVSCRESEDIFHMTVL